MSLWNFYAGGGGNSKELMDFISTSNEWSTFNMLMFLGGGGGGSSYSLASGSSGGTSNSGSSNGSSNNEEGPHFQVPEVVVTGKKGYRYTSDEVYDAMMFAFAKATKDMERQLERDWYAKGGQGNWFFGAGAALSGFAGAVQSEQMYTQGIRRGLSGNYALTVPLGAK
ncbi:hypothetical protein [Chryseobacterium vrystaatense]|uniref:Uncharacterized protein n=1 Tax=Chryseobacterium vrystaatense TaxID=307480 RepID=A0A1M5DXJ6_9FLAO|nr:hypothetical protein [Chryseobacterium vrystaatense]SHF71551.1 hypothetical protein SAMN02787073_2744 [Chryseobacterium vrystaatense]